MTHLAKILARNKSLLQFIGFAERACKGCIIPRLKTTSEHEHIFFEKGQSDIKGSGDETKSVKKFRGKHFQPITLKQCILRNVRSIVGISVDTFNIGWAKIDLERRSIVEYKSKSVGVGYIDYLESYACKEAKRITQLMPAADMYVMERSLYNRTRREFYLKVMLSSMLAVLLQDPSGPLGEENVLFQSSSVIDNLYKLKVNNERVSGEQVLQRMLGSSMVEQLDRQDSDIMISVKDITLTAERDIIKSMYFAKATDKHSKAIALFIALSIISANPILLQLSSHNCMRD